MKRKAVHPVKIPSIQLASNAKLVIASDIHIGAEEHAEEQWAETLDYVVREKARIFLNGDILENAIISGSAPGEKLLSQATWPTGQVMQAIDSLMPLAKRNLIVGITRGNHDARTRREGLLDLCEIIAHVLRVPYWGIGGLCRVSVGKAGKPCYGVIQHGKRAGMNPWTEVEKCFNLFPQAKFAALGHNHHFGSKTVWSISDDGEGSEAMTRRTAIRTGSYLGRSDYIREMIVSPCPIGSPILTFDKSGELADVDTETLSWAMG